MPPVKTGSCLSMDGRRHENEESWHDGCRECYCHNGREMCALITCPVPNCGNPTIHPGQCCPSCPGNMLSSAFFVIGLLFTYVWCFLIHENSFCNKYKWRFLCPNITSWMAFIEISYLKNGYLNIWNGCVVSPNMLIFGALKSLNKKQFPVYMSYNSKYYELLHFLFYF